MSAATPAEASSSKTKPWVTLGVQPKLADALVLRGFKAPTPIQRATLPKTLDRPPRDVLGMARTGSGKTFAYLIPVLQRISRRSTTARGPRALILCPNRELAVQILKTGKELARGLKPKKQKRKTVEDEGGKDETEADETNQPPRWAVLVGGTSLDQHFDEMSNGRPDIVIATPGRLLHLAVEMDLSFDDVQMAVYDEADRLFEMGFAVQLNELLRRLPTNRHSLLFSATLPANVAEFAKAGLNNPLLIRLDAESQLNPDLRMNVLMTKTTEKDAALLALVERLASTIKASEDKRAIIFVATKHHVEYVGDLLDTAGYSVSKIYGSLHQLARQSQLAAFIGHSSQFLVVTDVAARGLDLPTLDLVINYDFPASSRVFVHRVGRTARAGRAGVAWSLIVHDDLPYLHDLGRFLSRPLLTEGADTCGVLPQQVVDESLEHMRSFLDRSGPDLVTLAKVKDKGHAQYVRSRPKASIDAYKAMKATDHQAAAALPVHRLFAGDVSEKATQQQYHSLMSSLQSFRPGANSATGIPKHVQKAEARKAKRKQLAEEEEPMDAVDEVEEKSRSQSSDHKPGKTFKDTQFYLPQTNEEAGRDSHYSIKETGRDQNFSAAAQQASFSLTNDEATDMNRVQKASQLKWDRKSKKFKREDAQLPKMIKTESGALLPASMRSGRFKEWKSTRRVAGRQAEAEGSEGREGRSQKSGLRDVQAIRKAREIQQKRKAKNARPSRKRS